METKPTVKAEAQYGKFDDEGNYVERTYECPECQEFDGAHSFDCPEAR